MSYHQAGYKPAFQRLYLKHEWELNRRKNLERRRQSSRRARGVAEPQAAKTIVINNAVTLILIAHFHPFIDELPNGLRYWRWGGRGLCLGAGKTRSRKLLENGAESPASSAPWNDSGRSFSTRELLPIERLPKGAVFEENEAFSQFGADILRTLC